MPSVTRLATVTAVLGALAVLGSAPASGAIRGQEWWLGSLHLSQAWQASQGAGITVAVLGTGVAAAHPDLGGDVVTGPDYSGSGRTPGGPYWGVEGTAVAGIIAGHGHGAGGKDGIVGVAPAAKILSIRVTLEYNDPVNSDPAITRRLPDAIAGGIRYAVGHGARVIDLPLDPGTLGLTGQGDPAAAGGSQAERAAVGYALSRNVVLVAPAGDDALGPGIVNYPAAYPGVIAVGAVGRDGRLASFSSRKPYVSLTAPGAGMMAATPPDGYAPISTTCMSSGIVAGIAALILSRYPQLTVAQVTRALTGSTAASSGDAAATDGTGAQRLPARSASGAGYGTVDAARAVRLAALIVAAARPARPAAPPSGRRDAARPSARVRSPAGLPPAPGGSSLAGSVLRDAVAAAGALIALLVAGLVVVRVRRRRGIPAAAGHGRGTHTRGLHEHGAPGTPPLDRAPPGQQAATPGHPTVTGWSLQGSSLAGLASPPDPPVRSAIAPVPRSVTGRAGRGAEPPGGWPGPPWEPAPKPERPTTDGVALQGTIPGTPGTSGTPGSSGASGTSGTIRVPGDMTAPPAFAPPHGLDFAPPHVPDFTAPHVAGLAARRDLDFAAAPVPDDYTATDGCPAVGGPGDHEPPPGPPEPADPD